MPRRNPRSDWCPSHVGQRGELNADRFWRVAGPANHRLGFALQHEAGVGLVPEGRRRCRLRCDFGPCPTVRISTTAEAASACTAEQVALSAAEGGHDARVTDTVGAFSLAPGVSGGVATTSFREGSPLSNSRLATVFLVALYILCDVALYIIGERASQGYLKQTVLCSAAVWSGLLGMAASFFGWGRKGLVECLDPRGVLMLLPVSASFCVATLGLLLAFRYFDGAFIKLLGQMKLPLSALLSWALLSRKYSPVQWLVIIAISASCASFTWLRMGCFSVDSVPIAGLFCVLVWILCNISASLFSERALKTRVSQPFPVVMTNIALGQLFTTFAMLLVTSGFEASHFFHGWDWTTLAVLATMVGDEWLSALMVKRLSTVSKVVTKCASLVVIYAIGVAKGTQPLALSQALAAMMIVQTTALFALV
eukprot:CAMPEP_0117571856 /NCGR_PEP_ID=MMETSP0784-20121206/59999_1 /TAXON_ID=39447 /ORGANISM="" /LENGTH=423 /DNA_ID=CAMNT_0005370093 /DNA_START=172 /DNA_END=1444 /DNA_ORIENTATION=-